VSTIHAPPAGPAIRCRARRSRFSRALAAVAVAAGLALLAGCSGETAVPIDPRNPPLLEDGTDGGGLTSEVTHPINATPEMQRLARQQCLDDPTLVEGYVRAVDPGTGAVMAEITVACDEVRDDG
jgi:hypothetical protein